ncbi:glutamate-5-semialdehyde dehydrogenase [Paraeggerthella hongkongensis]|uniref:Gamma-glutamyl phosphate reductase n=1 Tax=Paraeggerthella hongkongensis TaxID=230658 RepID=A0A3N0BBR4_9ACTN|nr:glutamate-5-semialdehyde dehydrogenase [Paraeggerthella hongkongensis]RNL44800.1 glutamate-5-semialdehyde dehydrogenase [Paraeggerthella hongkongensis]
MIDETVRDEVRRVAESARAASAALGQTTAGERNRALIAMARALREHAVDIIAANGRDMDAAREAGTKESLLDRLMLDADRVDAMACALEDLVALPDPLGCVQDERQLYNGIELTRVSVPLGVVAVVYEARPNVTADATGICLKSGNAAVLRGGSLASASNEAVARVLHDAAVGAGMPQGCIGLIASTDRAAADELMQLHGVIDVLIPRGGAGLIHHCVEHSKVPVIETGTGNCHVYVHATADLEMARAIVLNAKCRRYGVCNAAETLLIDEAAADSLLPALLSDLRAQGVVLHADECALRVARAHGIEAQAAVEQDWATEYLAPEIAVKCVGGVDEAVDHVNRYGTRHSEAIVADPADAEGAAALEAFLNRVDAAAVYANASTAFTDGGQFGLGAEIGISTQKLHARGPFALAALTSYKYVLRGTGQVRA